MKREGGVKDISVNSKRFSQARFRSLLPNQTKGQVTVFIILGLVIVVFIGILFYVKQDLINIA